MSTAKIAIVAGPSGSGKSRLAERLDWSVIRLDDFYYDIDAPSLPMSSLGIPDWDHVDAWNFNAAIDSIEQLVQTGQAEMPVYDISTSKRVGTQLVKATGPVVIAEGIFAAHIVQACKDRGLLATAILIKRPRIVNFFLRLVRDIKESRKPIITLLRRGWRLYQDEPRIIIEALAAGCSPMNINEAEAHLRSLDPRI